MIETLRKKFILICMGSVFAVLFIIAAVINTFNYVNIVNSADGLLNILIENDGQFPRPQKHDKAFKPQGGGLTKEAPFSTRYFYVIVDNAGNINTVNTGEIFSVTSTEASLYATQALESGKITAFIDDFKFKKQKTESGTLIVFVDCEREMRIFEEYLLTTFLISLAGMIGVFVLVLVLSQKAVKPIAESYEKQKRFITDAGHELKTPITVLNASLEVLEIEQGENNWTRKMSAQTQRLSGLVNNLVCLARMDEEQNTLIKTDFPLSDVAKESAQAFLALAQSQEKIIEIDIEKNITMFGSEDALREMIEILLDNAVKYAQDKEIFFNVKCDGKKCLIKTRNAAQGIVKGDNSVLFDRFYRADKSRGGEIKGSGVGLSIAKSIVQKHKGKIKAYSPDGRYLEISVLI